MDIVVDTSAFISVITNEASKAKIVALTRGANLIAPESVQWEMGNALSSMIKRDRINLVQAKACIDVFRQIPIKWVTLDIARSLELVERLKIYAYDAYLIQVSQEFSSPLLTLDLGLRNAASQLGVSLIDVD